MHQGADAEGRRHHIERGRERDVIEPSQEHNQQGLSDISDTVSGHRRTVAEIGEQASPRRLLRLPAQKAEARRQHDIVGLQQRGSKRHNHDQDETQSRGEQERVPDQPGALLVARDAQAHRQRIGDERVIDHPQDEDGAEEKREFPVILRAERAREQHVDQEIAEAHHALIDERP